MSLFLHPVTLKEATRFVERHHRHSRPPRGGLFAVACSREGDDEPCGVAIVGRPVARLLADGWTAEVTRCCTDGTRNACSMLYGACWRVARALGYRKLITYTREAESGASLRAAAFQAVGEVRPESWHRAARPRVDHEPLQRKIRWERGA